MTRSPLLENELATRPRSSSPLPGRAGAARVLLICAAVVALAPWLYTNGILAVNRAQHGVYASAEDAMRASIARGYVRPDEVEIEYAGTNSFDGSAPHVWYVIACIQGGRRADGMPVGSERHAYDEPGHFFLNVRDGWVLVPEGYFPEVAGFFMKLYGLAGPGSAQPARPMGSSSGRCGF